MTDKFFSLPKGFCSAGISVGIRKKSPKPDLAVFYSEKLCNAAGVFTTNRIQAAPIIVSRGNIKSGSSQAIVANSGCANACTGARGLSDAHKMCSLAAQELSLKKENVLVASTGVIGQFLPMDKVRMGIKKIASLIQFPGPSDSRLVFQSVRAIMTTDTVPKVCRRQFKVGGKKVVLWACAKGSGMIHPNMATMLCFILTDAGLLPSVMREMLRPEVEKTFNSLSVDGDTSTNDCVFFLSNGLSGAQIKSRTEKLRFQKHLGEICYSLATQMASDGEGATKRIEIFVQGARTDAEAKKLAETVATSPLVKTAFFGEDANWGRILAAVGRSGVSLNPQKIDLYFGPICAARNGQPTRFSEKETKKILKQKVVPIRIVLHQGKGQTRYLTCDFSIDYVKINADYRS